MKTWNEIDRIAEQESRQINRLRRLRPRTAYGRKSPVRMKWPEKMKPMLMSDIVVLLKMTIPAFITLC